MRTSAAARSWRMRQWPNDPTVAHLVFVDHCEVPTTAAIDAAIAHATSRGARCIRTSALFPRATEVVLDAGFQPIDRLALLQRDLAVVDGLPDLDVPTRAMSAWQHRSVAQVDQVAFGPLWGNDAVSIREIRRATPEHRARVIRRDAGIVAFAISGAAGDKGYLQRLAVDPAYRRESIASALVVDALCWMHDAGLRSVLVNTGRTNGPALTLYASLGFELLDDELVIAELELR